MIYALIALLSVAAAAAGGGGGSGSPAESSNTNPFQQNSSNITNPTTENPSSGTNSTASDYQTSEYNLQTGLNQIKAAEAYSYLQNNSKNNAGHTTIIGIVDTGLQPTHVEASSNIYPIGNYDYINNDDVPSDDNGHGTHVTTTAAGVKNGTGMHGVAYNARVITAKSLDASGLGTDTAVSNGINGVANNGASVINLSLGGSSLNTEMKNALLNAKSRDALIVAATGNDSVTQPNYPARYASDTDLVGYMIAVGAVDSSNNIASFSSGGGSNHCGTAMNYCLFAPGKGIIAAYPTDIYVSAEGTSMAAPHVAGAAAVLRGAWPHLNATQVSQILFNSATDLGDAGVDSVYGHGLLNLEDAVKANGISSISSSFTIGSSGYSPDESTITYNAAFGDAFVNNISPIIQNAVFFDSYGRDYKAGLEQKMSSISHNSYDFDELLFNSFQTNSLPVSFGKNKNHNLVFNFSTRNLDKDYNGNYKFNKFGIKNLTVDNSTESDEFFRNSDIQFAYTGDFLKNTKVGFSRNDFDNRFSEENLENQFGFITSGDPYSKVSTVNFLSDNSLDKHIIKNQFFISQRIGTNLRTNVSISRNYDSSSISGFKNEQSRLINNNINYQFKKLNLEFGYGDLEEFDNRFLGSQSFGAFSKSGSASTKYFRVKSNYKIKDGIHIVSSISEGKTNMKGNEIGIFRRFSDIKSRGYSIAVLNENFFGGKFGVIYSEPLRVYKGSVDIDIPIARNTNDDGVVRSQSQNVSLKPDGKEKDLEIIYQIQPKTLLGKLDFQFLIRQEPDNFKNANNEYAGLVKYGLSF